MFYPNNSYMEDLYFYNQIPNGQYINNLGNSVMNNQMMPNFAGVGNMYQTNPGGVNFGNPNMFMPGQMINSGMPIQNLNNLYPSIYRIINPVVSKVVSNGNNQMINEEGLNNMVDTVFNIVEGQINLEEENQSSRTTINENQINQNQTTNTSSGINSNSRTSDTNRQSNTNNRNPRCDSLLKDLIKILIIKEIFLKNHLKMVSLQSQGMQTTYNPFFNPGNF